MELCFRRARRYLEERGDLVMFVSFHVVQHEDLSRAVGQLLERGLEVHGQIPRMRWAGERVEDLFAVVHALTPCLLRPEPLDDDIDGQAVQPRRERGVASKGPELLPYANE